MIYTDKEMLLLLGLQPAEGELGQYCLHREIIPL